MRRKMMAKLKFTNSKDGQYRADISVPVRLTTQDMAVHVISQTFGDVLDLRKTIPNMKRVTELVRLSVQSNGCEIPHYRVGDDSELSALVKPVTDYIDSLVAE